MDVSPCVAATLTTFWYCSTLIWAIMACVAMSSPHWALCMILSHSLSPSWSAFFAAFSMPLVIRSIPPITCSRLIFFPMPCTFFVSRSALCAASCSLVLSPFSAACVSFMPAVACIIWIYSFWYAASVGSTPSSSSAFRAFFAWSAMPFCTWSWLFSVLVLLARYCSELPVALNSASVAFISAFRLRRIVCPCLIFALNAERSAPIFALMAIVSHPCCHHLVVVPPVCVQGDHFPRPHPVNLFSLKSCNQSVGNHPQVSQFPLCFFAFCSSATTSTGPCSSWLVVLSIRLPSAITATSAIA